METVDTNELEMKVKEMYQNVAQSPKDQFHFEMGRELAEKLGYPPSDLDRIPKDAIESFAGVGYHFGLAGIKESEHVLDLGSGSGMDAFFAALKVGKTGTVTGVDMTEAQLGKSNALKDRFKWDMVAFRKGYIETLPFPNGSFDVVVSNGVINLTTKKEDVFNEVARILKPGGRLAISDIVTDQVLPEGITCDATLWASCIGGAMQVDQYKTAIEGAGLRVVSVQENPQYQFISSSAQGASEKFGVKSISLLAMKS